MKKVLLLFGILVMLQTKSFSQFTTPTIDGSIGTNEYGTHTDGANKQGNWYVTWDATNAYFGLTSSNISEGAVIYLDGSPASVVNGGTNADGNLTGFNYDGTNFSNLPFRAKIVIYFKNGYREYRTSDGSGGWSTATSGFGTYVGNGGTNTRELAVPLAAFGGLPAAFNFFAYVTSSGGYVYNQVPTANPSASIGTTATASYYYTISKTGNTVSTLPFLQLSYATRTGSATLSSSNTFFDFTLNTSSATFSAAQNVVGTVTVTNGGSLTTNDNLTLVSDINGTANIGNTNGTISGNVAVQRYIPAKAMRKWSFVASPVVAALNTSWQTQVHITGPGTGGTVCPTLTANSNGFDATVTNAPSMYAYNSTGVSGSRWTPVLNTTSSNTPGSLGFRMNIRGPRSVGCSLLDGTSLVPTAATLSASGAITNGTNSGNVSVAVNSLGTGADGFVLIGNPYPSVIDFSALYTANSSKINNQYVTYSPANAAGTYTTWNAGVVTNAGDLTNAQYIASGQSFFIQKSAAGPDFLAFAESMKATNQIQKGTFRTATTYQWNDMIRVELSNYNNEHLDEIVIRYKNNDAKINTVKASEFDSYSLNDGANILSSLKGDAAMSIQTRPLEFTTDNIILNIKHNATGNYQLNFSEFSKFVNTDIILIDKYLGTTQNILNNNIYNYSVTSNSQSQGNRFELRLQKRGLINSGVVLFPNPAVNTILFNLPEQQTKYTIKVCDITGKAILQQAAASGLQQLNIAKFSAGVYQLIVVDNSGKTSVQKFVKQ